MMDWLEAAARRMERTLNSKPRSSKTRAYIATLPKRKGPVRVSPAEYIRAVDCARKVIAAAAARSEQAAAKACGPRRDRLRPSARRNPVIAHSALPLLMRAQEAICAACGGEMFKPGKHPTLGVKATVDHVIPIAAGGADRIGNLVAMHHDCNNAKAARMPTGCERIWLLAVNVRLDVHPQR